MKIKIKQTFRSMWALILAVLMILSTFSAVAVTLNVESTGETQTTVYICPSQITQFSSYVNSSTGELNSGYELKLNTNHKGDGDAWHQYSMTKYEKTIGNKAVYVYTFTDTYNGLGCIQFQIYQGSTKKTQIQPFGTKQWTEPSVYNNKLYNGANWVVPSWDSSGGSSGGSSNEYTIYFKDTLGWNAVYAHFYTSDNPYGSNGCSGTGAAYNKDLTQIGDTDVYSATFTSSTAYTKVCFTKDQQNNYGSFYETSAAYRYDLDFSSGKTMYVPNTTVTETKNSNVPYYNDGTWETYSSAPSTYKVTTGVKVSTDGTTFTEDNTKTVPTGGGDVSASTVTTLTASDITGYTFVGWEVTAGDAISSTEMSVSYTPTANTTVYAKYKALYSITITQPANGSITINPTATTNVVAGTSVQFTASPVDGYVFEAWTDDLSSETSASVTKTVTSNLTVSATFKKAPYTVTLTQATGGNISSSDALTSLEGENTINLTATASDGYVFNCWEVTSGSATFEDANSATTTATVTDACTITAVFDRIPSVAESVTLSGATTAIQGDTVTYTATVTGQASGANLQYEFFVNGTSVQAPSALSTLTYKHSTTGGIVVKVVVSSTTGDYLPVEKTVTTNVTAPDEYYIEGRFKVRATENATEFTYVKNSSGDWQTDSTAIKFDYSNGKYYLNTYCTPAELSANIGSNGPYFHIAKKSGTTFTQYAPSSNTILTNDNRTANLSTDTSGQNVLFSSNSTEGKVVLWWDPSNGTLSYTLTGLEKYTIDCGTYDHGTVEADVSEATKDTEIQLTVTPEAGYELASLEVKKTDDNTVTVDYNSTTKTFTMPAYNVTVYATFSLKDYTMTGFANPSTIGGSVTPSVPTANKDAKVTFTATPVDGYSVTSWTISGSDTYTVSSDKKSVEVTVKTADVTATANYVGASYDVTQKASSNGTYTVTGVTAGKAHYGSTVIINPSPATGFVLDSITVNKTGDTTTTVPVTNNSFTMPAYNVTITVKFRSNPGTSTTYKFLYSRNDDFINMQAIDATVYENPTGTYTLTITDRDVISAFTATGGNSYFALSSTATYTGMFGVGGTVTNSTPVANYISQANVQERNDGDIRYKYPYVSFSRNSDIKQLVLTCVVNGTDCDYKVSVSNVATDVKKLADGVTLEATPTEQTIGKNVTLKATLSNVNANIPTGAEFTYTFKCGSTVVKEVTGTKTENGPYVATCTVTSNTAGTQSYTVTVSTKESDIVNYTPTDYESVTSNDVKVEYRDVIYYYAAVNPDTGDVNTRVAIPENNMVSTTVSDGGTYYFSVFDNDTDTSPESVVDYTVDSANNRYCTISKSSTETGLDYLIVKCNAKCSNPVIYFNKANKTVYAIATQNVGSSKTLDNSEKKVTYYFAEEKYDSTDQSDPAAGGDGMRIKYWNNSVNNSTYTGYADVTTKVIRPGTDNNNISEENNSIFVWVDKFPYPDGTTFPSTWNQNNRREFYIYSVDLPIWATSFSFVKANDTALTINNTSQIPDQGTTTTASIVLNPNRVYCFLSFNYNNYVRGVVLDDSLWDGNARNTANSNEMATQGFASNIVNYDTKTNNDTFNKALTAQYGSDYQHPLYFKNWYYDDVDNDSKTLYDSSYFKLHDNLAMRYKEPDSYYASIQHLTDNRLSTDKKNEMGNGYLLGYNGTLMPLFDYDTLKTNPTLVYSDQLYENVQFPFYASTFNGVTTYSYDSTTDRNREVSTSGGKTTVNVSNNFVKKGKSYGYFPFGGTGTNDTYGCGTEFDINFYMTNNGKLSNGDDIAFNFSGDDDVWVYVDGVRVLDLGGAHSVSSGTINFSDMMVYYKTAANATDNVTKCKEKWSVEPEYVKTVSLKDLFEANGATFSNTDASTQHTLQMFYLERGEGESNCSISFNLPQNTGFRVNSNVTTDSVNEALVKDTMTAANKDYFNYQIANKLASDDEYSKVNSKFTSAPAKAVNVNGLTPSDTPSYPINSPLISRDFLGTNYYLTARGATPSDSDNGWLRKVNIDTFTNLQNVNYTLSDAYAVKGASDTESSPSGRVSGTGIFNLLFGQSAIFESKIPNNTMIQLSQEDKIYSVNAGNGDTTVITAGDASTRTVSNYYSSSYSIVDDNTGLEIGSGNKSAGVAESFYADDASSNSDMFYFANYSGETNISSNAMTVTYTNDVLTSKIKLAKYVENPSATDNFYFKVEFSKIFGEALTTAKEYTDLQYTVYNSSNKELVATRTYGKAGVYFTANQYAIIEGVPVDSAYNVVEKDRAGYKFESASKTTYTGNTAGNPVPYDTNSVDGKTVSGAAGTTTYDVITFRNSKQAFTVKFKYYDRSVITGTTSHISTSPTIVTYSYATLDGYTEDNAGQTRFKLEELITNAYAYYKFDNVIDTYQIFTSQTAAEDSTNGAGSLKVLREGLDGVTPGVTTYSTAYGSINGVDLGLHYDCYGRPQGTDDCKATDGEDWVTYYNGSTKLSQTDAAAYGASVTSITVWLYNTPKKYMPTFYYADATDNGSDLAIVEGTTDRYVATTNRPFTISDNVYYNVRLGNANGNSQNDAATDYLKEYGISKGYCEEVPEISSTVTYNSNTLKFLYWASDPSGKNILSTDIAYGYRVTNNLKAYAVYGQTDLADKGLTITPNTPDYYSNSNGKALVRLNNVMNVYNCPERDKNIKNASIIYIIDYSKADAEGKTQMDKLIEAGGFDELQAKVREVLKANEDSKNFLDSENIVIKVNDVSFIPADYGDIDITGFNHKVVPYNEALNPGTDEIKLTNKNRVQFTTSFTKSNLSNFKMYAMLGMDYGELVSGKNDDTNSWIVSDNLLYYAFDENGNVSIIKDPILKHEFYNPTTAS